MKYDDIYIHYGSTHFDENLFEDIKNIPFVKPEGGLWASNLKAEYGWKEWTKDNNYMTDRYRDDNSFKFRLKNGARVLKIEKPSDLIKLPKNNIPTMPRFNEWLDFEKLKKEYDAIEVVINKLYWDLYGWDCDSILIMNKDIVEEV